MREASVAQPSAIDTSAPTVGGAAPAAGQTVASPTAASPTAAAAAPAAAEPSKSQQKTDAKFDKMLQKECVATVGCDVFARLLARSRAKP